ncbi:FemAB family XrtA/PEP-CTERM system-associated protein [Neptunicella sp.]|uniref:FemAB family XrtA/PEP-CTERM system-associated protein n=1 Tax=Neptunicella sp. TaxID=2125986 RepID=UPI003F694A51
MSHLVVKTLTAEPSVCTAWDQFVDQCKNGHFFHLSGWKQVIEQAYGHHCYFLYAESKQQIVGVLPLVHQKSRLFGNALVSTPFCVYGGVASDDPEVMIFLEQQAIELAERLAVDYLELRYPFERDNNLITRSQHVTFGCHLGEDNETILAAVKKKQRAVIRHSLNSELTFEINNNVEQCYEIYSESVRNLGTPVFPKHYFSVLKNVFNDQCEVLTVKHHNKAVSSVLSFYYKGQVLPYYGGGTPEARNLKSNDFMYYQLMCHARADKDCDYFDFGRSKVDSGAYIYKKHWGMDATPLHYQYHLVKADSLPNLSPNNPKYKLFINLWQKLPIGVSRLIGPFLSKYLG